MRAIGSLFLTGFVLLMACEDIFEKDLEGKEVVIVSPADMLKTQYTSQNFWWEEMHGALTYNLQIASPSFDNIEKLLIDTNVNATKFVYTLYPGKFQWRIRPVNGSSQGKYVVRSLEIDTTLDLRGQEVILKYPANGYATNRDAVKFAWNKLYNAEDYRFELKDNDGNRIISPILTQYDTISIVYLSEGIYQWGVQAQNNGSATLYSTRRFFIDLTNPKPPVLTEPKDSTTINTGSTIFKWVSSPDGGSLIHDSIVLASDRNFKAGSIKIAQRTDGQTHLINMNENGKFYWKVFSVDAAGNISLASAVNLLIVGSGNTSSQLHNEE